VNGAKNRAKNRTYKYDITPEMDSKMEEGIENELKRLQLCLNANSGLNHLVGERSIAKSSKETYWVKFRALKYFLALIGDYESILILLDNAPKPFCPSINPDILILFIKWKHFSNDKYLMDYSISGRRCLSCDSYLDYTIPSRKVLKRLNKRFPKVKIYRRRNW
jgi:hypothetical protein